MIKYRRPVIEWVVRVEMVHVCARVCLFLCLLRPSRVCVCLSALCLHQFSLPLSLSPSLSLVSLSLSLCMLGALPPYYVYISALLMVSFMSVCMPVMPVSVSLTTLLLHHWQTGFAWQVPSDIHQRSQSPERVGSRCTGDSRVVWRVFQTDQNDERSWEYRSIQTQTGRATGHGQRSAGAWQNGVQWRERRGKMATRRLHWLGFGKLTIESISQEVEQDNLGVMLGVRGSFT